MNKSVRTYRKTREYDYVAPPPPPTPETASAYTVYDGKGTAHGVDSDPEDLLSSPREFVPLEKLVPGDSSPLQVVALLVAGGAGATVIAAPYTFLEGGFVLTSFLVAFLALASCASSVCLVQLGVANGIYSLPGLAKLAFGNPGAHIVGATQLAVSCGLVLTYLAIAIQDLPVVLGHALRLDFDAQGWPKASSTRHTLVSSILSNRTLFAELFAFVVAIPLCLALHSHRRIRSLALAATLLLALTSLSVVGKAKHFHEINAPSASRGFARDYLSVPPTGCRAFGILATQFASQHHAFHAFYVMRGRSVAAFAKLALVAALANVYLVSAFGVGGYVSFLSAAKSDVLRNFDFADGDTRSLLPFWLPVPLCALFCLPLEVASSRHALAFLSRMRSQALEQEDLLFRSQPATRHRQYASDSYEDEAAASRAAKSSRAGSRHHNHHHHRTSSYTRTQIAATFAVLAALAQVVALSSAVDVAAVLSVTGGVAGIALVLVVPAACSAKLTAGGGDDVLRRSDSWASGRYAPWSSIALGVAAAVACLASAVVARGD